MPITAQQLATASSFTPDFFGPDVIEAGVSEEEAQAQLLDYINREVLPLANGEVELPVREALGDMTSDLSNAGITVMFGDLAGKVIALWDAAETSYGRSELNKRVNSDNAQRDTDSDQDRIQGNDRLKKLLMLVAAWKSGQSATPDDDGVDQFGNVRPLPSHSRQMRSTLFGGR